LQRWDIQFYSVLIAVTLLVTVGAFVFGVDTALSVFLGAAAVSINFAVLIALGQFFFKRPGRRIIPMILLTAHIFITPGLAFVFARYLDVNTIALLSGVLMSATISPMAMAIIGLVHAKNDYRFSFAAISGREAEERQ